MVGKKFINEAAESFNAYFINSLDKLISQYPKKEDDHFAITSIAILISSQT
jgi:hypothetical protein